MKPCIGVLISGSGTNLAALIDAFSGDDAKAAIGVVISNRADAYGLQRAVAAGIPAVHISNAKKSRVDFDRELIATLQAHGVEWVALAGFMRILSPVFLEAFTGRVINIHPSLLPSFPGLDAQEQAFKAGVKITGATVHFVDAGLDTGRIIAQGAVPRFEADTIEALRARILAMEHELFPMVMAAAVSGRLSVEAGCVAIDGAAQALAWQPDKP
jgi:phosphoribosylglycinamide formyltransferase-1